MFEPLKDGEIWKIKTNQELEEDPVQGPRFGWIYEEVLACYPWGRNCTSTFRLEGLCGLHSKPPTGNHLRMPNA